MMEELRRRKKQKDFFDLNWKVDERYGRKRKYSMENVKEQRQEFDSMGPERHFKPINEQIFDPSDFTLIFIDSDSVTNVTTLNRINQRRVLIFAGNGAGICGYGKGKGEDYEQAFALAFKELRERLVCVPVNVDYSQPTIL